MKEVRLFLVLVLGLVLSRTSYAGMAWRLCDDAQRPVAVQSVVLTPDPPVIGTAASFLVQGTTDVAVDAGTVDIDVSFSGIQIFGQSEDLCAKTACPVAPGTVSITLVEALPPIAPPGDYGLRVTGRDASGAELLCLDVDFELVMPSLEIQGQVGRTDSS